MSSQPTTPRGTQKPPRTERGAPPIAVVFVSIESLELSVALHLYDNR